MNQNNLRAVAIIAAMTTIATMFTVLCLALLSGIAHAQITPPPVFTVPADVPSPLPSCWPERIGGTGKGFVSGKFEGPEGGSVTKGQYAGWWCELPGEPRGQWRMAALWGGLNYVVIHPDIPAGSTMAQIAAAYWTANVKLLPEPPTEQWQINMNAAIVTDLSRTRPATPPAPVWVVAASALGSRPLYEVVNGALVARTGRATSGTACDCSAPFSSTYCIPAGQTKFVALCTKRISP